MSSSVNLDIFTVVAQWEKFRQNASFTTLLKRAKRAKYISVTARFARI